MSKTDFFAWLSGYVELSGEIPNEAQWKMIVDHLKLAEENSQNPYKLNLPPGYYC
jgi:hypothetical protein